MNANAYTSTSVPAGPAAGAKRQGAVFSRCNGARSVALRRCAARATSAHSSAAPKGVLCDLDGTLYDTTSGSLKALPGAVEAYRALRSRGVPWLFVTNTTTRSREALAERLQSIGIPATPRDVVSPPGIAADWLRKHRAGPAALFVAPGVECEFEGVELLPPGAEAGAGAVVVGDMGSAWSYDLLNRAFRLVVEGRARAGAPEGRSAVTILSLGKAKYFQSSTGLSLDAGPFTAALEFATGEMAVVLGKPDPLIFCLAAESLGLQPHEVVMVGDDINGDVAAPQSVGLRGLLVRTGKFRPSDLAAGGVLPYGVLPSLAALPDWWAAQQAGSGAQ